MNISVPLPTNNNPIDVEDAIRPNLTQKESSSQLLLGDHKESDASTRLATSLAQQIRSTGFGLRILVCGDFLADNNARLFSWLETAADELPMNTKYLIKPHPTLPVEPQHYPSLIFQIREDPIASLLQECDVVFAGSTTSTAVDAFCAGVPVVQMRDGCKFDTSPRRGWSGIVYVESPKHLAYALLQAKASEVLPSELFNFDPGLARWASLLRVEGPSPL